MSRYNRYNPKVYGAGDTRKLRLALEAAGFPSRRQFGPDQIWSDTFENSRRLKLVHGNMVFDAPQKQQRKLEEELKKNFGDRYMGGFFIPDAGQRFALARLGLNRPLRVAAMKNFCVRLKKV